MKTTRSYACSDFPGMEDCPGYFRAATDEELWRLVELHAAVAHGEDPAGWTPEIRAQMKDLIKSEASH